MTNKTGWYSNVHPVLRILCFIVFSLFLALGNLGQLGVATILVVLLFITTGSQSLAGLWPTLRRMRWFLLSIFIIYAWLTPGPVLFSGLQPSSWLPTTTGLIQGGQRMLALILIIASVHWLLFVTPRNPLVAALYWLAAPLQLFGISRQSFAVRISLILTNVMKVQTLVGDQVKQAGVSKGDIKGYASVAAGLVEEVITRAEQTPCEEIEINVADKPAAWQWLWPLLLTAVMLLAGELGR